MPQDPEVESISVESDKLVESSRGKPHREEWEEDLTSTQNLALSNSALRKKQATYIEPTVKLNNYLAPDASKPSKSKTQAFSPNKIAAAQKFSNMV